MSSELPISSKYRSTPEAPVSDGERDDLNARLNSAYTDGSLDAEDYQARLDVLFRATTLGQLVPVVDGLPARQTYDSPAIVASSGGRPGEVSSARGAAGFSLLAVGGVALGIVLIAILFLVMVS